MTARALILLRQTIRQTPPWAMTPVPLQTLLWYPSLRSTTKPMTVGDYVQLANTEIHFNAPDEKENRWRTLLKTSFDVLLWAVREAKPAKGRYPILIYAPSDFSVSWENADLCEYLASYGYVVLASPSMGMPTIPPEPQDDTFTDRPLPVKLRSSSRIRSGPSPLALPVLPHHPPPRPACSFCAFIYHWHTKTSI
jgi:hypothetical protein